MLAQRNTKDTAKSKGKASGSAQNKTEGGKNIKVTAKPKDKASGSAQNKTEGGKNIKVTAKPKGKASGSAQNKTEGGKNIKVTAKPKGKASGSAQNKTEGEENIKGANNNSGSGEDLEKQVRKQSESVTDVHTFKDEKEEEGLEFLEEPTKSVKTVYGRSQKIPNVPVPEDPNKFLSFIYFATGGMFATMHIRGALAKRLGTFTEISDYDKNHWHQSSVSWRVIYALNMPFIFASRCLGLPVFHIISGILLGKILFKNSCCSNEETSICKNPRLPFFTLLMISNAVFMNTVIASISCLIFSSVSSSPLTPAIAFAISLPGILCLIMTLAICVFREFQISKYPLSADSISAHNDPDITAFHTASLLCTPLNILFSALNIMILGVFNLGFAWHIAFTTGISLKAKKYPPIDPTAAGERQTDPEEKPNSVLLTTNDIDVSPIGKQERPKQR